MLQMMRAIATDRNTRNVYKILIKQLLNEILIDKCTFDVAGKLQHGI